MKFEVVNRLGSTVMSTEFESCVYDLDDLTSMYQAGYRFKVDGKFVSLGKVLPTVKSSSEKQNISNNTAFTKKVDTVTKDVDSGVSKQTEISNVEDANSTNLIDESTDNFATEQTDSIQKESQDIKSMTSEPKKKFIIRCKETGQTWNKQIQAAEELGITPAQVSNSIKTGKKRSGYTFERVEV